MTSRNFNDQGLVVSFLVNDMCASAIFVLSIIVTLPLHTGLAAV